MKDRRDQPTARQKKQDRKFSLSIESNFVGSKKNLDREINRRRTEIAMKMESCCRSLANREANYPRRLENEDRNSESSLDLFPLECI